jgi:serine/threonine protein kinase
MGNVDLARHHETGELMAVKSLVSKRAVDPRAIQAFTDAIGELVMFTHPCILPIRGCSLPAAGVGARIATDYNPGGSLAEALFQVKAGKPPPFWNHQTLAHIIVSIALGMQYLHTNGVIHGALKPSNCLLYDGGLVKVCDYGFIRFILGGVLTVAQERPGGPPGFKAPESTKAAIVWTDKMDVFSFGLILTEILTESDFFSRRAAMMVAADASAEFRPPWGSHAQTVKEAKIRSLCQKCWLMNPEARPSFTEILEEFDAINYNFWPDVDPLEVREFLADVQER